MSNAGLMALGLVPDPTSSWAEAEAVMREMAPGESRALCFGPLGCGTILAVVGQHLTLKVRHRGGAFLVTLKMLLDSDSQHAP